MLVNLNFLYEDEYKIRAINKDGEAYFVGKDIADALGYKKARNAIQRHVDEEDKTKMMIQDNNGVLQETLIINESGMYSLILKSQLEGAKKFKRWVTSDVLPSIRKHGMYATDDLLDNPDLAIAAFKRLKAEKELRLHYEEEARRLNNQIEEKKPYTNLGEIMIGEKEKCVSIGSYAKLLKNIGIDTGRNRLFKWLRDKGYLMNSKNRRNIPYQQYIDQELFTIKNCYDKVNDRTYLVTFITPKGQTYIYDKLKEDMECSVEEELNNYEIGFLEESLLQEAN